MKTSKLIFAVIISFGITIKAEEKKEYVISANKTVARDKPSYLGKPLFVAQYGQKPPIISRNGAWLQVAFGSKKGWIHQSAMQESYFILKEIGKGKDAANKTYKDEVVAAGKGFTPEYEKMLKAESPELNYGTVDEIESWLVGTESLIRFGQKGGLESEMFKE